MYKTIDNKTFWKVWKPYFSHQSTGNEKFPKQNWYDDSR